MILNETRLPKSNGMLPCVPNFKSESPDYYDFHLRLNLGRTDSKGFVLESAKLFLQES